MTSEWTTWVARNLLRGVSEHLLRSRMIGKSLSPKHVDAIISEVKKSPVYEGARSIGWRVQNLECLLDIKRELSSQIPTHTLVDRRCNLSTEEFHSEYYARNQPVIIEGLVEQWPAFTSWTPNFFREKFGNSEVEVQSNRQPNPVYEVFLKGHSKNISMAEFCDSVEQDTESNHVYLTANDRLLDKEEFRCLREDFWPFPEYFSGGHQSGKQFIWIGPKGSISPLHRDKLNVFMTQIYGTKRIKLISSESYHHVYNYRSFFSHVDAENPDLEKYPSFANVNVIDVELKAGESLFIPVGWWHHVRSLSASINISLTNFRFGNCFSKYYRS